MIKISFFLACLRLLIGDTMGLLTKNKVYLFFAVLKINKIVSNLLKRLLKKEKKKSSYGYDYTSCFIINSMLLALESL